MNSFEQMEEKSEVIFTSGQLVFLAFGIVILVLASFIIGYSMGKKSERKRSKLGMTQSNDLLARLDKLEEESKNFKAKRALTALRKREVNTEEENLSETKVLTSRVTLNKNKKSKYSLALARTKNGRFGKRYGISRKRNRSSKRNLHKKRFVKKHRKITRRFGVASKKRRLGKRTFKSRRRVYAFKKSSRRNNKRASR